MIARVIPVLRLPRGLDVFDYRIPDDIQIVPGQAVAVPFRSRTAVGIVESLDRTSALPAKRLKSIARTLTDAPLLTAPMLRLAKFVAASGYASLGTTLRSMLPKLKLRETLHLPESPALKSAAAEVRLLTYRYDETKLELVSQRLETARAKGRSVIVVVPTIQALQQLSERWPSLIRFDRGLSDPDFRQAFLRIRRSDSAFVVGTRSSVFAPVNRLSEILILDEDADELIQDEPNPRYDARAVAVAAASMSGAAVSLISRFPTLTSWQAYQPATELDPLQLPTTFFIDLETVRRGGDYGIVADEEIERLRLQAESGHSLAVVHAQAASFGSLECSDCDYVALCPTCAIPLRVESAVLICRHCGHSKTVPTRCPNCHGVRLKGRGRGIEFAGRELERHGLTIATDGAAAGRVRLILPRAAATLPDRSFRRIVVTRYDSWLSAPRHDADERARRLIHLLAAKLDHAGVLVIQASPRFHRAVPGAFDPSWRAEQLRLTETYGFPPAWRLIQLRRRGPDPEQDIQRTLSALRNLQPGVDLTGPIRSRARSSADRGGTVILIRTRRHAFKALDSILSRLNEHWTVTVDPRESA